MDALLAALGGADCERIRSGWLAQPANALSSLVFVGVGIWLLTCARSTMVRRGSLVAVGGAMVTVGIGSFAFHGPQPGWAHAAHDASIVALGAVIVGAVVWSLARGGLQRAGRLLFAWKRAGPWLALALVAYWAGRTASSLCRPESLWQYHAAWHALSALAVGKTVRRIGV